MRYLPFVKGVYSVAPALTAMNKAEYPEDKLVFQIDRQYQVYLENKGRCRAENIHKYYCEERLEKATAVVCRGRNKN